MSLLAGLSLRNRGLTALVSIVIFVVGLIAIPNLKQQLFPSLDFPAAFVMAGYPGAAPDIVDRQVAEPITAAIQGVPGLKSTSSTSQEGSATIQVEFEYGTDLDSATEKLNAAIGRVQAQLPQGVTPTVTAGSTSELPVVVLAASSTADEQTLAERLRTRTVPEIQKISGVREAAVTGARDSTLVIVPDLARLTAAGVDIAAIGTALRSNGVATAAGTVTGSDRSLTVQVGGALTTLDSIKNLYLTPGASAGAAGGAGAAAAGASTRAGREPVRLADVAEVSLQPAPATSITRTNGRPSLGLQVTATPDGNAVKISDEIRDQLPRLRRELGDGAQLTAVFDQAPYVQRSINGLTREGLLGLGFAVLVILAFLFSLRSTLVTAVSIPLSVVIALIALWAGDYSLNILTLGALTIAIGRVVDDSIVVLENIKRHLGYGEDKYHAVTTAVREVAGAVTASTITTVAVFSPIALVGGLIGELFSSFAITVTVALVASLLVSLTVIPVLAFWFLKPPAPGDAAAIRAAAEERERSGWLQRSYIPVIEFATSRRRATVALGIVIFIGTGALATGLKTNFFDQSGQTSFTVRQTLPVGTSLAGTDAAAQKVEEILKTASGVQTYQATIGGGGGGFGGRGGGSVNTASFSVTVKEGTDTPKLQDQLRDRFAALSGAGELKIATSSQGFSSDKLAVIVKAGDDATLGTAVEQVRGAMAGIKGVVEVESDLSTSVPRIEVTLDRQAAARYGLSDTAVGQSVAAALRGTPLGQVTIDGASRTVVLRLGRAPANIDQIRALPVGGAGPLTLGQVAQVREVAGPVQVTRVDGERSVTVTGTATGSNVGQTSKDLTSRLDALDLPAGATVTVGGVSADQNDAFADLGLALLAAIAIVYFVMAVTFRSLIQPLILLVSIPFAATGALTLLLVTDTALGVPALIGALMLVGIVVTNAIVLMDLINKYRADGMDVREAVIEGGRHRLRPILMTAVATICALLPMALGMESSGGFISQPLAIMVIGGLVSSTLLTLVLVPTLYTMVEEFAKRRAARAAARVAGRSGPGAGPGAEPGAEPQPERSAPDGPLPIGVTSAG